MFAAAASGCEYIAVRTANEKDAAVTRSAAAIQADTLFWRTFHGGNYDGIPAALEALTRAYLETPTDAVTAAHIAWLHSWRLAESARLDSIPATITESPVVARKFFQEAVRLDPSDARYRGFLAGMMLAEASIHGDERLTREGYFTLRDAIDRWPEFNLFTAGYIMSRQPSDSERFTEGLEWEWENLDICVGERLDRKNPDYSKYMHLATTDGPKRVCWNSWIAPHNFEGFFLNMGDMLVKARDWQTARKVYAIAKLSPDYERWPFRAVLEDRIRNAEDNVEPFNAIDGPSKTGMMIRAPFACMACHQR